MGLSIGFSRCSCESSGDSWYPEQERVKTNKKINSVIDKNPDPSNFDIYSIRKIGKFVICEVKYPNCNNFEGLKILVYENVSVKEVKKMKTIDPHFCDKHVAPIARFIPTDKGLDMAIKFCEMMK